jgi:hypothetical protein
LKLTIRWLLASFGAWLSRIALPPDAWLADSPNEWREVPRGGFSHRWLPGAFGDRAHIRGVRAYKVIADEWETKGVGSYWRTITKAEIIS